jgi:pimeloyl-ACP methyl ester carboxylesterase
MLELPGVTHRHVEARGMRFHVAEAGDPQAPPVFLTHGWPQHWWIWRHVIAALQDSHRLIAWDLRGLGWSDAAPDGDYTKTAMADDLLAVMDAVGVERAGLIGHDWGAFSGMIACLKAPERFIGLVSCSVPHLWPRDRFNPRRLVLLGYQVPVSLPWAGERMMRAGFATRLLKAGRARGRWTEEELHAFGDVMREPKAAAATVGIYRQFLTKELPQFVRGAYAGQRLHVPTRVLVGTEDVAVKGSSLAGANADDLEVHWIDGVGHFLPDEEPEHVVQHARELFS